MTTTFGTNSKNDIYIGNDGNIVVLHGNDAVLAACRSAARALLNEMIYATGSGIPYFETVWVGSPNYQVFRNTLINTFLSIEGVLDVPALSLAAVGGVLNYTAQIKTQFGLSELTNG